MAKARTRSSLNAADAEFSPVPIPQQIADRIYDLIVRGELRPGDHINELQLSQRFGVSRAPIREAARLLENKGLSEWSPRHGFFVKSLTARDVDEIFEVRLWLEEHAIRGFFARTDADHVTDLARQLAQLRADGARSENHLIVEGDMELHHAVVSFAVNGRFLKIYDNILNEIRLALSYTSRVFRNVGEMIDFHGDLLAALEGRDEHRAILEIRRHLTRSRDRIKLAMAERG